MPPPLGETPARASGFEARERLDAGGEGRPTLDEDRPGHDGGEHVGHRLAGEGGLPVSISKSTTPKAQTSARRSTDLPRACSGDM